MRGGQHQVLLLLKALRDGGHDSVLLAHQDGQLAKVAAEQGFQVHPASLMGTWKHSRQVDIVHAHDAKAHTLAALAAGGRFVVSRRVAFPVQRSAPSIWKYRRAALFLAVSQFVMRELQSAGVPREKIDVVHDAVDTSNILPLQQAENWNGSLPAVALASDDPLKGKDLVQQSASAETIPILFSHNLLADLSQASMFVYITRSEGFGSAALLAMEMGVPVIASRVGGMAEVFEDNVSGIYVENDQKKIREAMRRVLAEPGLAQRLILAGRKRVRDRFTRETLLENTLASYRRALDLV